MEKFASPGKGNGLRLLKAVKPGQLLYRAAPFAYIVSKKRLGGVCEHCLRSKEQLPRCSQCKIARYCGAHCQKEAWLDHKRECKCIKDIDPNFPPDSVRLVGRIIFKVMFAQKKSSHFNTFPLFKDVDELSEDMKEGLRHLAKTLQLYLKVEIQDVSQLLPALDIFQIFAKVSASGMRINL
uniref:[histone H3]-lysine(4) N-trimethyltransferase n=1 Tax=Naja naja TaxID=35670 RepID=A0A8C6VCQ4_NAJNA